MRRKWKKILMAWLFILCMIVPMAFSVNAEDSTDTETKTWTELDSGALVQGITDITTYRVKESGKDVFEKTPDAPKSGYIFAGWYTDENCAKESALASTVTSENIDASEIYYAKFVPADILTVRTQITSGTKYLSEDAEIRFVTSVDTLNYQSVGFDFVIEDEESDVNTDKVYRNLYALGKTGKVINYTPGNVFHSMSTYFMACTVTEIPNEAFGHAIEVTPYWITLDGTKVLGETALRTVNMGYMSSMVELTAAEVYNIALPYSGVSYGAQGGCTDGKYYYQAAISTTFGIEYIQRYDMSTGDTKTSGDLSLDHANDITYNKDLSYSGQTGRESGLLVVCHNAPNRTRISFVDPDSLGRVAPSKIKNMTWGSGVTVSSDDTYIEIQDNIFSIDYNAKRQQYVVGLSDGNFGQDYRILKADFSNASDRYESESPTSGYTTQGVGSDDGYIYYILYYDTEKAGNITYEYVGHVIAVYDWSGKFVTVINIPNDNTGITTDIEPENISVYNNKMYIACTNGSKTIIYQVGDLVPSEIVPEASIDRTDEEGNTTTIKYGTFAEAMLNAEDGDTITLLQDKIEVHSLTEMVAENVTITNEAGRNVTLTRGSDYIGTMIANTSIGLTIKSNETGTLTIDEGKATERSSLIVNGNGTLALENITIQNVKASKQGGAVYATAGTLTVDECKFLSNQSSAQGTVLWLASGVTATVTGSEFDNNVSSASGGAIYNNANLTVTNTSFISNQGTVGGAINCCGGGTLTATNCTFGGTTTNEEGTAVSLGNISTRSTEGGGAVSVTGQSNAIFNGTTGSFVSNNAMNSGAGGAIYTTNSEVSVTGYTFTGNTAGNGGAIYSKSATIIEDTDFTGNNAGSGGAILQEEQLLTIRVSENNTEKMIFKENEVTNKGGAIRVNNGGALKVTGYTFEANHADSHGGAILTDSSTVAEIKDCVFGGETTELGNTSNTYGGAIYTTGSADTTTIQDTSFKNNSATSNNADVYNKAKLKIGGVIEGTICNEAGTNATVNAIKALKNSDITMDWISNNFPTDLVGIQFANREDAIASTDVVTLGTNAAAAYTQYFNGSQMLLLDMLRTVTNYDELSAALTYIEENDVKNALITIGGDIVISKTVSIKANVILVDDGNERTISRGLPFTTTGDNRGVMFDVESGKQLTFKSTGTDESPRLIIDGNKANVTQTQKNWAVVDSKSGAAGVNVYAGVKFINNRSGNAGGVFLMEAGTLNIYGGLYEGNTSASAAGVIELKSGTVANIENATFRNNEATHGGAIEVNGGTTATITNCTFESNNSTKYDGGAIYVWNGAINMKDCTYTGNSSVTNKGFDVYVAYSTATVQIAGEMVTDIYNAQASRLNVNGALTDGSDVTIDWNSALPTNNEGVVFTSDDNMNASKHYISLGGTQFATYSLVFVNQKGILEAPFVVTDFEGLKTAVETTMQGQDDKTGVVRLANSFDFTGTVTIPEGYNITIEDNGSGDAETLTKKAAANMFVMSEGATLTFRSSGTVEEPKLIVDGNNVTTSGYAAVIYARNKMAAFNINILEGVQFKNNISKNGSIISIEKGASANVYIDGARFENNSANSNGGGVLTLTQATAKIKNSVFAGNSAGYGGVMEINGKVDISNCTFTSNNANSGAYGGGVIFHWQSGVLTITDCTFDSNTAVNKGGVIYFWDNGTITFNGTNTFTNNTPKDIYKNNGTLIGNAEYTIH